MKHRGWLFRSILMVLIMVLVLSVTGCQPKLTPKETLLKIQIRALTQKNFSANFEGQMDMTFEGDVPPESEPFLEMLKNIKYSGDLQVKDTETIADMAMHYTVNMNGLSMDIEAYFDGEQMIVKYPVMPQYIVVNMKDLTEKINEEGELPLTLDYASLVADLEKLTLTWAPGYISKVYEGIDETTLTLLESHEFELNGESVTSKAIKIDMTPEMIVDMLFAAIDQSKESKELYDVIKKYDVEDAIGSFEDFQKALEDAKAELENDPEMESFLTTMENMQYSYIIGYDKKYNPTMMSQEMTMNIDDEAMGLKSVIHIKGDYKMSYEDVDIVFPEINEQNSLSILDMMGEFAPTSVETTSGASEVGMTATDSTSSASVPENDNIDAQMMYLDQLSVDIAALPSLDGLENLLVDAFAEEALPIMSVYFATIDGKMTLVPDQELPADYDPRERPWYRDAISMSYNVALPYQDFSTSNYIQTVSKPVEVNGTIIGVLGIDFYIE